MIQHELGRNLPMRNLWYLLPDCYPPKQKGRKHIACGLL